MQVPLGIFLKGEQKYEEMVQVLDHLHQYVPTVSSEETICTPHGKEKHDVFHPVGLGECF